MIRLALRSLLARPILTALTGIALATMAISAGTVATFARSTQAQLVGDARQAWQTPYDLLVRPVGSQTALEVKDGLVRPNFMAGVHGGISPDQLDAIRSIAGVEVAAPIAMVGFVNWYSLVTIPVPRDVDGVYRVTARSVGEAGLSHYDLGDRFIVVSHDGAMMGTGYGHPWTLITPAGRVECSGAVQCFAGSLCQLPDCSDPQPMLPGLDVASAGYELFVMHPLIIAGIDPEAEAKLAKLDSCVTTGRYLSSSDLPTDVPADDVERLPVLVSSRSFVDETLTLTLSQADDGGQVFTGNEPPNLTSWTELAGETHSMEDLYQSFLSGEWAADPYPIWTAGDVGYQTLGDRRVRPIEFEPDLDIYHLLQGGVGDAGADALIPPAARDVAYRDVQAHGDEYVMYPGSPYRIKEFKPVGTYDPGCIPGWDPLAGGKLDAYSYPTVRLEDGRLLTPTRSMSGYINSPPLLLTSLDSAAWLSDPQRFHGQPGRRFISVIRVKVSGAEEPGDAGEGQLQSVALAIHERTGLQVDVVKGSSLASVAVELPPGRFGRPAEVATEEWSLKGVVVRFVRALESQAVGLVGVGFVVATVFVGTATFTAMRRRRREFATLRALGWPVRRLAMLVELEVLLLAAVVAVVVTAVGVVVGLQISPVATPNFLLASLLTVGVALTAGAFPAISVYRGSGAQAMRGSAPIRHVAAPRSIRALAFRELAVQSRTGSFLAVAMLATGVVVFGLVTLVAAAFSGTLDLTILGRHIAAKAEPHHFIVGALVLALGAVENAQLLMLTYSEKREHLATLQALGWPRSAILKLVAWHGFLLAGAGAVVGSTATVLIGAVLTTAWGPLVASAAAGGIAGFLASAFAIIGVLWHVSRVAPLEVLRGE